MVYIHFPSNLTEEELMLQAKYQKLKKKVLSISHNLDRPTLTYALVSLTQKKALQAHKAPKQEQEKPILLKRPADARDAREVARKLIKSGAIQAIQRPITKQDQTSFKRPKGQERKRPALSEAAPYQPFSSSHTDVPGDPAPEQEPKRVQDLYQDYASKRDRGERGQLQSGSTVGPATDATKSAESTKSAASGAVDGTSAISSSAAGAEPAKTAAAGAKSDKPKSGNTIYVSGNRLTEDYLHKQFDGFGKIVNISMEIEKGRGFITFVRAEAAEQAIKELDGKTTGGVQLLVQLARRQPQIDPINDASSSATWSTLGKLIAVLSAPHWMVSHVRLSHPTFSCQSVPEGHAQTQSQADHLRDEYVRLVCSTRKDKQSNTPKYIYYCKLIYFLKQKHM